MGRGLRLEPLAGLRQRLDVVGVGVRGDQELALREREVERADEFDHLVERVLLADVDERPLGAAVDEVDVHPERPAGLEVQLDHAGEQVLPLDHRARLPPARLILSPRERNATDGRWTMVAP